MNTKSLLKIGVMSAFATALIGCTSNMVNTSALAEVKKVAVVMYSVPETIVADTRDPEDITESKNGSYDAMSLVGGMLSGTAKKVVNTFDSTSHVQKNINGQEAANISLTAMIVELSEETGWSFLTPAEVASNTVYQQQSAKLADTQRMQMEIATRQKAAVPDGYLNLGLPHGHGEVIGYQDTNEYKDWVRRISRSLNVDAIIIVSDTGYATDGKSLFSGGACYTKSAMHITMFDVNGELIVNTRASFDEAPEVQQSGCVSGSFFRSDYKSALVQHGTEQGRVIAEKLSKQ